MPVLIGTIFVVASLESTIGLSSIILVGTPEAFLSIVVIGSLLFWLANKLMAELEKLRKPNSLDHFRQSSFYYVASIYASTYLIQHGYYGGLSEAYMLIALAISVWAIIINTVFLYKRHKE
ncbi:MAG: hypothetical protein WC777_03325 [Candidatus Gracilibacteria bacterium]|jgi:hypothetical protein